jgi:alpha-galactosidase
MNHNPIQTTLNHLSWGKTVEFSTRQRTGPVPFPGLKLGSYTLPELLDLLESGPQTAGSKTAGSSIRSLFSRAEDLFLQPGGWQSWSSGWELAPGEHLPRRIRFFPNILCQTAAPGDPPPGTVISGHFLLYLRSGEHFLCLASAEGDGLPPLHFRVYPAGRNPLRIDLVCYCPGRVWQPGETLGELRLFLVEGYFAFKDRLRSLYAPDFGSLAFLCPPGPTAEGRSREGSPPVEGKAALPGGYESWYNHYTDISEELLLRDLKALGETENLINLRFLQKGSPAVFQIDDGWERAVGDWEIDSRRFPGGLKSLAERIEGAGLVPGLWLAPFLVTRRTRVFSEKPQWLLRDERGRLVPAGWNPNWDGTYYCLDLSRPELQDYLDDLIRTVIDDWGFRYIKLDFLYAGLFWGAFAGGGSPDQHYRRACGLLTRRQTTAAGKPVAYLGCGVPLGLSYRSFPLSRIGADTRETWDWSQAWLLGHTGRPSALINLRDTLGRSFMEGSLFRNDPDVVFLRSQNCRLGDLEKELIALVNFLLGGQIMFSDSPGDLSPEDLALTRRIEGLYQTLEGDDYGALRLEGRDGAKGAPDAYRLLSKSGRTGGIINLESRPLRLGVRCASCRDLLPVLAALPQGSFLTDHRLRSGPEGVVFAPRSITLWVHKSG